MSYELLTIISLGRPTLADIAMLRIRHRKRICKGGRKRAVDKDEGA